MWVPFLYPEGNSSQNILEKRLRLCYTDIIKNLDRRCAEPTVKNAGNVGWCGSLKMKYLFGTKLRFFWVIIPMLGTMSLALAYNSYADGLLKFYPLIVFLGGCVIFTVVYLFRVVGMSFAEVKTVGLFSSRERVMINEGRTLTLTLLPKKKLLVELYGNDGVIAELDWLRTDEDGKIPDINLFREKALGTKKTLAATLRFYGVPKDTAEKLLENGGEYADELISVSSAENEQGKTCISINFLKTV